MFTCMFVFIDLGSEGGGGGGGGGGVGGEPPENQNFSLVPWGLHGRCLTESKIPRELRPSGRRSGGADAQA